MLPEPSEEPQICEAWPRSADLEEESRTVGEKRSRDDKECINNS
jgi:hypothetical protein